MSPRYAGAFLMGLAICTPPIVAALRAEDTLTSELSANSTETDDSTENSMETDHMKAVREIHEAESLMLGKFGKRRLSGDCECGAGGKKWIQIGDACPTCSDEDADCGSGPGADPDCICEWDEGGCQTLENVVAQETGPADEKPNVDTTGDAGYGEQAGNPAENDIGGSRLVVEGYPIISQNSIKLPKNSDQPGDHACWAVARASAMKFANMLGTRGPKTYAAELYKASGYKTGWFAPDGASIQRKIVRLKKGHGSDGHGSDSFTPAAMAKQMAKQMANNQAIVAAMGRGEVCEETFHYVSIVGMGVSKQEQCQLTLKTMKTMKTIGSWTDDFAANCVEFYVSDAWCKAYTGAAFFTMKDSSSLDKYDTSVTYDDNNDYTIDNHPCIKKARMIKVTKNKAGDTGQVWLNSLAYSGGETRCIFKMWAVSKSDRAN